MAIVRGIAGVIAGWIVALLVGFASLFLLWSVLGAEKAFEPNSWVMSNSWVFANMGMGLIAAFAAGLVCKLISASTTAVRVFAGIVLVLGLAGAAVGQPPASTTTATEAPTANTTLIEAMQSARKTSVHSWTQPVIGCIGILLGGAFIGRKNQR